MNSLLFSNIIRFTALVLLQVLICNQMNFLGSINPYIYILFILIYPVKNNSLSFIFISFVLGILIDVFMDTGGAHAADEPGAGAAAAAPRGGGSSGSSRGRRGAAGTRAMEPGSAPARARGPPGCGAAAAGGPRPARSEAGR